ncbi:hypothetical protein O6H91_04G092900 [Diphasiastrum complanatum]|uniref:Uncharacterized protein n=1 Tax=Diphasiastrum complanatum TaxID=34168 RepID=A0ACC2E040_DIPCM|nr:hypothetical protein O6H91_04G092900 [Diphasiastrum complanatum]
MPRKQKDKKKGTMKIMAHHDAAAEERMAAVCQKHVTRLISRRSSGCSSSFKHRCQKIREALLKPLKGCMRRLYWNPGCLRSLFYLGTWNLAVLVLAITFATTIYELAVKTGNNMRFRVLYLPLYPAHAVGLAFACRFNFRVAPGNFIGFYAARIYFSLRMHTKLSVSHAFGLLTFASVEAVEVHLCAYLLRRFICRKEGKKIPSIDSVKDALLYLAIVTAVSLLCATLLALIEAAWNFQPWPLFLHAWATWWLGIVGAKINVSPFVIHCFVWKLQPSLLRPVKLLEGFLLTMFSLALLIFTFIMSVNKYFEPLPKYLEPVPYALLAVTLYSVFRFNRIGWTVVLCAISVFTTFANVHRRGTLNSVVGSTEQLSPGEIIQTEILVSITGVMSIILAAAVREAKQLAKKLNKWNEELEMIVEQRTKELVKANEELQASKKTAEQASHAKSQFLTNMSHEIRTPIHGILGMTAVMLESELTAEQKDNMLSVKECADLLLHIINSILDLAKVEAGHLEVESLQFGLRRMLKSTMRMLLPRAQELHLDLRWEVRDEIPDLLLGDPGKLQQCLLNLVSNSLKFTHEGSVKVTVKLEPSEQQKEHAKCFLRSEQADPSSNLFEVQCQSACSVSSHRLEPQENLLFFKNHVIDVHENDSLETESRNARDIVKASHISQEEEAIYHIRFAVSDTGIGISNEKLQDIFSPFTQADSSISRLYGGTGLGLCIVKRFTGLMGGKIFAESEIGKGSTFSLVIPLKKSCSKQDTLNVELFSVNSPKFFKSRIEEVPRKETSWEVQGQEKQCVESFFGDSNEQKLQVKKLENGIESATQNLTRPSLSAQQIQKVSLKCLQDESVCYRFMQASRCFDHLPFPNEIILKEESEMSRHAKIQNNDPESSQPKRVHLSSTMYCVNIKENSKSHSDIQTNQLHILLAEDNPVNQKVASHQLRRHGHTVTVVGDGLQALHAVNENRDVLDLVLMDVQMPIMDGLEATHHIRREEIKSGWRRIPIIGLTAHAIQGYQETCLSAGMDGYLGKPFDIKQLLDAIDDILQVSTKST